MLRSNLHTHTTFCDGKNTPEEMARAAAQKGFVSLGFSGHSPAREDDSAMTDVLGYQKEIARLKALYAGRMAVYAGIEQDYLTKDVGPGYDYRIGSVHCLEKDGVLYPVDYSRGRFEESLRAGFNGDALAFAKLYFETVDRMITELKPDVIGHFDLVRKFNAGNAFFDEDGPAYRRMAEEALRPHARDGIFEVNTGVIFRGYRDAPYPAFWLLKLLREENARITITSDAHSAEGLDSGFVQARQLAREAGFESVWQLSPDGGGLREYPL
ncbi:MAG: histidinol-phosphatase [Oscillospiraceae bacterium]|nr:histidinol-phosphatase [Oscillospiraceae bacterium]